MLAVNSVKKIKESVTRNGGKTVTNRGGENRIMEGKLVTLDLVFYTMYIRPCNQNVIYENFRISPLF